MSILFVDRKRKFSSFIARLLLMKEINRVFISFLDNWPCKDSSQFFVGHVQLNLKKKKITYPWLMHKNIPLKHRNSRRTLKNY